MTELSKKTLAAKAVENVKLLDGTTDPVKRILANADLVFAVWPDAGEKEGVGTLILKGQRRLKATGAGWMDAPSGTQRFSIPTAQVKWDAIPCNDYEHAYALSQTLGEPDTD